MSPRNLVLDHQQLLTMIDNEKFYSSIVNVKVEKQAQPAIVRDVQMHPARNSVVHIDLQRVIETEKMRIHLPIHFKGEAQAPGVKTQGGIVSHLMQDVEVVCLPAALPEFLELDMSGMNLNETLHLKDVPAACRRGDAGAGAAAIRWWSRSTARVLRSPSRRPWPPLPRSPQRHLPRAEAGKKEEGKKEEGKDAKKDAPAAKKEGAKKEGAKK